jgi:hypothetical protein
MGKYWKSILSFVALVVTNVLAMHVAAGSSTMQWVTAVATTVVGTFVVWVKANA